VRDAMWVITQFVLGIGAGLALVAVGLRVGAAL
jgi:hypothetical protein